MKVLAKNLEVNDVIRLSTGNVVRVGLKYDESKGAILIGKIALSSYHWKSVNPNTQYELIESNVISDDRFNELRRGLTNASKQ